MGINTNQYDELDHPRMGMVRETTWKDPLLVKYELGKVKRSVYNLPDARFIYGMINPRDAEGVKEGEFTWYRFFNTSSQEYNRKHFLKMCNILFGLPSLIIVIQHPENEPDTDPLLGPNFIAMNKIAALKNCTTSPDVRKCRDDHYVRMLPRTKLANCFKLPSEIDPSYTYGGENVLGPPIEEIVSHAYQNDWIKMNQWLSENHPDIYEFTPTKWKPSPTNSSILRVETTHKLLNKPPTKPKFCMNRFKNIKKRIDDHCDIPFIRDRVYPNLSHWHTPIDRCSLKTSKCANKHAT